MPDQHRAYQLARRGFDLWQEGRLEESAEKYRESLEYVDPDHDALGDYHGEFAAVLATLGRDADARVQYELALAHAARQDPGSTAAAVSIARYFLGEHLLRMQQPAAALAVVEVVPDNASQAWLLRFVHAKALWLLGRREESRHVARSAIRLAPTAEKQDDLGEQLGFILDSGAS